MREILYFQAGTLANHIGTHFWNTQESYFTYGEDDEPIVFHDRSFREGLTLKCEPTYCPRLLIFDRKSQFGSLADNLYGSDDHGDVSHWEGGVVEYRQDPIPKSDYQTRLDEGETENEDLLEDDTDPESSANKIGPINVRFWSDYSRVFFHPRSLQRLPDLPDWDAVESDWIKSRESFSSYEQEHELMENEVRTFAEECDAPQGIQLISDCSTFGGFTDSLLTALRDDFPKLQSLAFPLLSPSSYSTADLDNENAVMQALNDALCLRGLEDQSTMNVLVQAPSTWRQGSWRDELDLDISSVYQTSAILATHIETATLPLRLKTSNHDLSSLSSVLNRTGDNKSYHLTGMFPVPIAFDWSSIATTRMHDFSGRANSDESSVVEYASFHVTRGFNPSDISSHDDFFTEHQTAPLFSTHAPSYPIPTSFPSFLSATSPPKLSKNRVLTTLTASTGPAALFAAHARVAQKCVDQRADVVVRMGLEFDEVRELKDELWVLADRYAGEHGRADALTDEDELGEDEE